MLGRIQSADPKTRIEILDEVTDERLRQLGMRVLLSESPELLKDEQVENAAKALAERWKSPPAKLGWITVEQVRLDLERLTEEKLATGAEAEEMRAFIDRRVALVEQGKMPS